ncbi:MAG: hypothetical protein Q9227_009047 [Pyrenula ochraceoflavens]
MSTSEESDEETSLQDLIVNKFKKSVFNNTPQEFLPEACVAELITKETIARALRLGKADMKKGRHGNMIDFILQHAKKVFALTVYVLDGNNLRKAMEKLMEKNFTDESLPALEESQMSDIGCFSGKYWSKVKKHNFLKDRWIFLAPVFSGERFKLELHPDCILPFTKIDPEVKEGTFSQVLQITIEESHLQHPVLTVDGRLAKVAIKEIKELSSSNELQDKVNKEWEAEAKALNEISGLNHVHLIQRIAAFTKGGKRYFMFQWADGGSLRDFWERSPNPNLNADFVKQVIYQLRGLADAIHALHTYNGQGSYRHGDLKPENILLFTDSTPVGTLKIADMGLAKHHDVATHLRQATSTRYGTVRYEPPEVVTHRLADEGRSRLYDIWSMGCIVLELMIWMLYGYDYLKNFNEGIKGSLQEPSPYFKTEMENGKQVAEVHPKVRECMDDISRDQECMAGVTAMSDLLNIVRTKLLVVALPQRRPSSLIRNGDNENVAVTHADVSAQDESALLIRASAKSFCNSLDEILGKGKSKESYWFTGKQRDGLKAPRRISSKAPRNSFLSPTAAFRPKPPIERAPDVPQGRLSIQTRSPVQNRLHPKELSRVHFDRVENMLRINEGYPPVLSVCRSLGKPTMADSTSHPPAVFNVKACTESSAPQSMLAMQIGPPELPEAGGTAHFAILRRWLKFCDENHPKCRPLGTVTLPTRLMDVEVNNIRLVETKSTDSMQFLALSHPWGDPPHFCTFTSNIEEHKRNIDFGKLPEVFKHAVTTTRALGYRYLWIDSICIIQGSDGDFSNEAKRMEDIFSSAQCVLAASSATGQNDGFLKPRKQREYVTFQREGLPPYYACRFIDDFTKHVLESPLSKRGWVLQERALAKRTIYFTDRQTYWECGGGVRCETFTKTHNTLASFIGDPNFPEVAIRFSKGEKIRYYQDLYKQYSRLQFTRAADRPIAIAGLEKRLIRNFKTSGGFGVFDDGQSLLQRSLLWHRGSDEGTLHRIIFPANWLMAVPTWSWMAYKGGIDYLDLEFDGVDWEEEEIRSPWTPSASDYWHTGDQSGSIGLNAVARHFDFPGLAGQDMQIIYDVPSKSDGSIPHMNCVILGRSKGPAVDAQTELIHTLPTLYSREAPSNSTLPRTSDSRLQQSHSSEPKPSTVLYLAYGSNLSAETFRGARGIKPLSSINVAVPNLKLTFDLPGIPYSEPCFANTALRDPENPSLNLSEKPTPQSQEKTPLLPTTDYHKTHWHKPLIGTVYEVTPTDYAHIIATEGGGSGYQDILIPCHPLSSDPSLPVPNHPDTPPFQAHTLFAPIDSSRNARPDPSYAQPSPRYLKLITDGADEQALPTEYREYLHEIRTYRPTTTRQRLGQFIFLSIWMPIVMTLFTCARFFAGEDGRFPEWLVKLSAAIFSGMWATYDGVFRKVFGDGERTVGDGRDDGVEPGRGKRRKLVKRRRLDGDGNGGRGYGAVCGEKGVEGIV